MVRIRLIGIDDNYIHDAFIGALAGLFFVLVYSTTSLTTAIPAPIYPQSALPAIVNLAAAFVVVAILAPVFEEPLFRGAIFFLSRMVVPMPIAIVVTSFAFSFFHWTVYGEALAAAFVGAFIFSVVACLMVLETKSLIPAVVMHAIVNSYLFITSEQLLVVGGV